MLFPAIVTDADCPFFVSATSRAAAASTPAVIKSDFMCSLSASILQRSRTAALAEGYSRLSFQRSAFSIQLKTAWLAVS
jgi:hypothetical protein